MHVKLISYKYYILTFENLYLSTFSNNLLYPKEDKERKILLDACRFCDYTEVAYLEENCVYRNEEHHQIRRPELLCNAYADPTLPRVVGVQCPLCWHPEVVFFLTNSKESMARTYACLNELCGHNWRDDAGNNG